MAVRTKPEACWNHTHNALFWHGKRCQIEQCEPSRLWELMGFRNWVLQFCSQGLAANQPQQVHLEVGVYWISFSKQPSLLLLKVLSSTKPQSPQQRIKGVCILEACWAREVAGKARAWQRSSRSVLIVALCVPCVLINGTFPSTYLSLWSIATFAHLCYQAAKLKTPSSQHVKPTPSVSYFLCQKVWLSAAENTGMVLVFFKSSFFSCYSHFLIKLFRTMSKTFQDIFHKAATLLCYHMAPHSRLSA